MTENQKLYKGISKVAWGYFFLYFNININNVSILPAFVGYLLFSSAIKLLKDEEREISLLETFSIIMALWSGVEWCAGIAGVEIEGMFQFADIVISLINLYFHFQLVTNIASIAAKYQPWGCNIDTKLLRYRTLQTIMLTAIEIVVCFRQWLSAIWVGVSLGMALIYIIAGICLMKVLFDLRKCFCIEVRN